MFLTSWSSECIWTSELLNRAGAVFSEINIEEVPFAEEAKYAVYGGSGKAPTIVIERQAGRTVLIEPDDRELAEALKECG